MGVSKLKRQAKVGEWKRRIMDCRSSGIAAKQCCAAYGGNPSTYYQRKWELFKKNTVPVENSIQATDNHPKHFPCCGQAAVEMFCDMIYLFLLPLSVLGG